MKRITLILLTAITITAFANQTASAAGKHKYVSPDHQMKAVVSPVAPKHKKSVESRVDIYDADGKLVSTVDYSSPDGEHGMGVVRAAWTPDSQFFVYSMASSGGHQPWKSPTWFFIRSSGKTQGLEQSLGKPVLSPNFSLKAPNTVIIETSKKSPTRNHCSRARRAIRAESRKYRRRPRVEETGHIRGPLQARIGGSLSIDGRAVGNYS
jgi:hypothetical protein